MNPALLALLLVTLPSLILLPVANGDLRYFFMLSAGLPIAVALWQIIRFTLKDPYQLRNDRHVERMTELRMGFQSEDGSLEIPMPADPLLIENPGLLEEGK